MQAEVGEEEVLGVRGPGAKPGYNTQYEVRAVDSDDDGDGDDDLLLGHDRLRLHLGLEHRGAAPGAAGVALHAGLRGAAQVQGDQLPHQAVPRHVGGPPQLPLRRGSSDPVKLDIVKSIKRSIGFQNHREGPY